MRPIDVLITPFYILFAILVAWLLRKKLTDRVTRRYYFPALAVKIIGAISLGIIYYYYYSFGDTRGYYMYASDISRTFISDPVTGLRMIFVDIDNIPEDLLERFSHNKFLLNRVEDTYMVVRIASVISIFGYHSYGSTAVLFALLSFSGSWLLFQTFYRKFPHLHRQMAIAVLFVPSVFFWGSGILKDTITLAALGWLFYAVVFFQEKVTRNTIIIAIAGTIIAIIKLYILLCFIIGLVLLYGANFSYKIRHQLLRLVIMPLIVALIPLVIIFIFKQLGEINPRFALENLTLSAQLLASEQHRLTNLEDGSGYSLGAGVLDFSLSGLLIKIPMAINVTFFRPYLWEIRNPVMAAAALESVLIMGFFLRTLFKKGIKSFVTFKSNRILAFCLAYSVSFAAAIGMTSYNFGTLVRYKIPCIPFFLVALVLIYYTKKDTKFLKIKRDRELLKI